MLFLLPLRLVTEVDIQACHPDLVLKSKKNIALSADIFETTVCRQCNDVAEDAIESKCHHVFDRECIRQYLATAFGTSVSFLTLQRPGPDVFP
jgi:DNA repair protein RAD16